MFKEKRGNIMDIKYILGILVVILLLGNVYFIYEAQSTNQSLNGNNDWAVFGGKLVKLPDNYSLESEVFSNGHDDIQVYKSSAKDVDSAINKYSKSIANNYTIKNKEFNSTIPCKKTIAVSDNSIVTKYWFKLDDNVYQIQVNNDTKFDKIVKDMLDSMA